MNFIQVFRRRGSIVLLALILCALTREAGAHHLVTHVGTRPTYVERWENVGCPGDSPEWCLEHLGYQEGDYILYAGVRHWHRVFDVGEETYSYTSYEPDYVTLRIRPVNEKGQVLPDARYQAWQDFTPANYHFRATELKGEKDFQVCKTCGDPVHLKFERVQSTIVLDISDTTGCGSLREAYLFKDGVRIDSSGVLTAGQSARFEVFEVGVYEAVITDGFSTVNIKPIVAGWSPATGFEDSVASPEEGRVITKVFNGPGDVSMTSAFPQDSAAAIEAEARERLDMLKNIGYDTSGLEALFSGDRGMARRLFMASEYMLQLEDMRASFSADISANMAELVIPYYSLVKIGTSLAMGLWGDPLSRARWKGYIQAIGRQNRQFSAAFFATKGDYPHSRPAAQWRPGPDGLKPHSQAMIDGLAAGLASQNPPTTTTYCDNLRCLSGSLRDREFSIATLKSTLTDLYAPDWATIRDGWQDVSTLVVENVSVASKFVKGLADGALLAGNIATKIWYTSRLTETMIESMHLASYVPDPNMILSAGCDAAGLLAKPGSTPSPPTVRSASPTSMPESLLYDEALSVLKTHLLADDREAMQADFERIDRAEDIFDQEMARAISQVASRYATAIQTIPEYRENYLELFWENIRRASHGQAQLDLAAGMYFASSGDPSIGAELSRWVEEVKQRNRIAWATANEFLSLTADIPSESVYSIQSVEVQHAASAEWDYDIQARVQHSAGASGQQVAVTLITEADVQLDPVDPFVGVFEPQEEKTFRWRVHLPLTTSNLFVPAGILVEAAGGLGARYRLLFEGRPNHHQRTFNAGWNFTSVPCRPYEQDAGKELGSQIPSSLQLYHFLNGGYQSYSASEPERVRLQGGDGYWLWLPEGQTISVRGRSPSLLEDEIIPLESGWNQIGNPFDFPLAWKEARIRYRNGDTVEIIGIQQAHERQIARNYFYWYENGGQRMATAPEGILKPWLGYWVRAERECELVLTPTLAAE